MKRFLLFAGDFYYPSGGMDDFKDSFNILEDAVIFANNEGWDWIHILDIEKGEVIWKKI